MKLERTQKRCGVRGFVVRKHLMGRFTWLETFTKAMESCLKSNRAIAWGLLLHFRSLIGLNVVNAG